VKLGATLVLQDATLPADIADTLEKEAIPVMAGVPPIWLQMIGLFEARRFPKLRLVTNSGGAMPVEIVRRYRAAGPSVQVFLMYGLTEAFRSTYLPPDQVDVRPASMGKAIPECTMFVVGPEGQVCGPDEPGELVHRGPTVAIEYWRDEKATAEKFKPDVFPGAAPGARVVYSGDLVKMDAEGYLYFLGRRDSMLKSFGFRISPEEVEEILYKSGTVKEAIVHGVPDPVAGVVLVAHCVPADAGAFSTDLLVRWCSKEMPSYMVPRKIKVWDAFPRTSSGKIDRKLVAQSADG
jgi:acyl-CoA synthetase (AMP-forming)/AMP-acid ligase II